MNQYVAFKPIIFLGQIGSFECFTWRFRWFFFGPPKFKLLGKKDAKDPNCQQNGKAKDLETDRQWIRCTPKLSWETSKKKRMGNPPKKTSREVQSPIFFKFWQNSYAAPRSTALWFNCGSLVWTPHVAVHCCAIHQAPRYWTFEKIRGRKVRGQ